MAQMDIGKNLCTVLDYENKQYIKITRNNINNIHNIHNIHNKLNNNELYIIYCIHDFNNNENNIIILKNVLQSLQIYNIKSFVYLSSWVVLFNKYPINIIPDSYTKSKIKLEHFLYQQNYIIKNIIKIVRPSLVTGKCGQFDNYINILKHFEGARFVNVYELSYLLLNISMYPNNYDMEYNVPSHSFYNINYKNNILISIFKNIIYIFRNIIPSSLCFLWYNFKLYPKYKYNITENILFNNNIMSINDCYWILNNIPYPRIIGSNYKSKIQQNSYDSENVFCILNYNQIITQTSTTIKVCSGMTISQLLYKLIPYNKTIAHIPEYCEMSIGAAITTHIHGNSFFDFQNGNSCLASCIKSYDILFNNKLIHCEKDFSDTDIFYKYIFEEPHNKYIIINVELYLQDEYTLYKNYLYLNFYDRSLDGIFKIFNTHIKTLIIPTNQLTIQFNIDEPNILTIWVVTKNIKYNCKTYKCTSPSYNFRRHVSYYLSSPFDSIRFLTKLFYYNILILPYILLFKKYYSKKNNYIEADTSSNILNQFKHSKLEYMIMNIFMKYNPYLDTEFLILYTDLVETLYILYNIKNVISIGIRFTISDNITKYKYNVNKNQIICWVECIADITIINKIHKLLSSKIITYHFGKYIPKFN